MRVLLILLIFAFSLFGYSQNGFTLKNTTINLYENARWNVDKYVWSHTHYKISEKDKPAIDFDAIDNWPGLGDYLAISADGRFIAYNTVKGSGLADYKNKQDSLIIQSTLTSWHRAFPVIIKGFFSADSKQYVFQDKERLCFQKTGGDQISFVNGVASYKVWPSYNAEWIIYQLKTNNCVVLRNLSSGKEKTLDNISAFDFDNSGNWLVCQLNNQSKDLQLYNLKTGKDFRFASADAYAISKGGNSLVLKKADKGLSFTNLVTEKTFEIWHPVQPNEAIKQFAQDEGGSQVVFTVEDENKNNTIWYYKDVMNSAVKKVNSETKGIDDLAIESSVSFTDNGNYIQFSLAQKPVLRKPMEDAVQVDVWSYQDKFIQPEQKYQAGKPKKFSALIDLKYGKVVRLEKENETLYLLQGDFAIIKKHGSDIHGSRFWEEGYYQDSNWLVSLKDGNRISLPTTTSKNETLWFSPGGKYLVFFDAHKGYHYFSYDLAAGKIKDISAAVPGDQLAEKIFYLRTNEKPVLPVGIAAWIQDDKGLLVYDSYDIWQLDLSGEKPAINLTNGYGSLHNILFNPINGYRIIGGPVISSKEPLLLKSLNQFNKYNGYYRKSLGKTGDPELLYMGPCVISVVKGTNTAVERGLVPLKANDSDRWIVQKQTANLAPNYFVTKDFKNYKQLTYLQPEKNYNWLTAELVSFKQLDGSMSQGVLYKPENFDSTKKYPVLIPFYTQNSDMLNFYPTPVYFSHPYGPLESPIWMVSHGYLVFISDIYFTKNKWGPSTVNTIDGAATYLKTLSYVDSDHLGAAGFSNSGRFGYYLLTHSNSFAAMSIGSGYTGTDVTSLALSLDYRNGRTSNLAYAENESAGTALGNLWENKASWIDHTAVLQADNAKSPLLLFHNNQDGDDPRGALELYTAFRRLEKPLWWLQYDQGLHSLYYVRDCKDFTIRYTQFFDHFLKQAPAPKWMTQGVPATMKGIEYGYDLDSSGSCGKDCKVCRKRKEQYD